MLTISKAKPKECQKIRKFEEKIWKEKFITSPYDSAFFVYFGYVFVAKDQGKIVGAIIAIKTRDDEIKIIDWLVDKNYRHRGIGEKLYKKLEKQTAGHPILAFVESKNIASINGHKKLGFKKIKKLIDPFYLGDKKVWWLMKKLF